jgi:hypothetical protein
MCLVDADAFSCSQAPTNAAIDDLTSRLGSDNAIRLTNDQSRLSARPARLLRSPLTLSCSALLGASPSLVRLAARLISYHLVSGRAESAALLNDGEKLSSAFNGEPLTVHKSGNSVTIQGRGGDAAVVSPDIPVCHGCAWAFACSHRF